MSHSQLIAVVVVACLGPGCTGEQAPGAVNQDVTADVGTSDRDAEAEGTSETDSRGPGVVPPVTRNPACKPAEELALGATVPWRGFEHEGTTYTCNICRGGLADLQGTWRVLDFQTEDPDVGLTDGWAQTFTFDGNTWRQRASWQSERGPTEEVMDGWYWCGSKPEIANETKVFVVTGLTPANAFGYDEGYVFTTDLLVSTEQGDKLAFWFYDGFNTGQQLAEVYCRVGTDVTTLAGDSKPCADPFED